MAIILDLQHMLRKEKIRLIVFSSILVIIGVIVLIIETIFLHPDWWIFIIYCAGSIFLVTKQLDSFFSVRRKLKRSLQISEENTQLYEKKHITKDDLAVAYCVSCGSNLSKRYSFCPKCGSCKVNKLR